MQLLMDRTWATRLPFVLEEQNDPVHLVLPAALLAVGVAAQVVPSLVLLLQNKPV